MWHGLLIDQKLEKADTSKFWQLLMNDCIDSCSPLSRLPLWVVGGTLRLPARLGAYFTVLGSMSCHMWHMFCTHNQYMFYTILTHFTPGIRISTQNLHSCNTWRAIKQSLYVFRIFSCFKITIPEVRRKNRSSTRQRIDTPATVTRPSHFVPRGISGDCNKISAEVWTQLIALIVS